MGRTTLAHTASFVAAAALAASVAGCGNRPPTLVVQAKTQTPAFSMSGSVSGLYPGGSATLTLQFVNNQSFPIAVGSASASAGDASAGCPATWLAIGPVGGFPVTVAAHSSASRPVTVQLVHAAPDACQRVTFPLTFTAQATKA